MLFHEVDYWSKLSAEEAQWLRAFNRAHHQGFVTKDMPREMRLEISRERDGFRRDCFSNFKRTLGETFVHAAETTGAAEELEAKETLARVIRHGGLGD